MDHQASNAQSTNSKGDNSLPMSSRPTEAMLLTNSSTQTDLSPLFRFNPTTDPFQPGAVEKPGNSTTNSGDYFFAHDQSFDIPYTTETQYISQDLNIDMNMNIEHDVSMTYMPMDEPVIAMPTVESLDLSIQILWAEHQMRTQFLEGRLAEAVAASDSLRKDVDAMAEWIQRIYDHLDSSLEPSAPTQSSSQDRVE